MKIELPPTLEEYIASLVHAGVYTKSDEVVAEAVREHQQRRQGMEVVVTQELERLLDEGLENLELAKNTDHLRAK